MKQFVEILRPLNCTVAGAAGALAYWLSAPLNFNAALIFISIFLICGAGNTVNDFFDREIDRKTKKHRPLPSGRIEPADALLYSSVLFFLGILIAYNLGPVLLATAILASILLIAYPMAMKKIKWLGNILVSALVALPFLYGGLGTGNLSPTITVLVTAAFFANFSREIVKDIEDIRAKEKGTIPKIFGKKKAGLIAALFLVIAIGVALSAVTLAFAPLLAAGIGLSFCSISRMISQEKGFAKTASRYIKLSMILIILAFFLGRIF